MQERIRTVTRVRACNYVNIETGRNFPPLLKIVTHTAQVCKMLMLLCVHMTSVLFLVRFNNFALTMASIGVLHALTLVARSYVLLYMHILG